MGEQIVVDYVGLERGGIGRVRQIHPYALQGCDKGLARGIEIGGRPRYRGGR